MCGVKSALWGTNGVRNLLTRGKGERERERERRRKREMEGERERKRKGDRKE